MPVHHEQQVSGRYISAGNTGILINSKILLNFRVYLKGDYVNQSLYTGGLRPLVFKEADCNN